MATIIAKVAEIIGISVLSANLWRREPTPEPALWQKVPGFSQKTPGFAKKAAGYKQKAAGFARNPSPFLLIHVRLHLLDNPDECRHVLDVYLRVIIHVCRRLVDQRALPDDKVCQSDDIVAVH